MIGSGYKSFFDKLFRTIARKAIDAGIRPNQVTLFGFGAGASACLFLIFSKNFLVFFALILITGLFDVLDGVMARLGGQTTRFGAYLDAMCDRYFEAMVLLSVALVTGYWITTFILLAGAFLTSYAKSRAAMEVPVLNTEWPDFLERGERSVIFLSGLLLSQIISRKFFGQDLFYWTLLFLAIGTHATVIQRMLRARKIISGRC